ncbi:holo-ACP synthase [Alkalicaulis satelles]|uniref:Holo-[acyl-carrier-protein] synthase n=1 Tax=Alkalicaulis satelles TaxID=2609175 RepID=A0A5M6ZJ81_9PROT|nr:holo-ACP synthase [Alkalicaulis satelles]KAA5804872.1 holo-ACP synthase [Alkalicaulis satelles]
MIIGVGTDIIDIRRIERSLERFGDKFRTRVFTEIEQAKAASRRRSADTYAKRFAAKEACAKALGTGIYRGVTWRQIEVINLKGGKPTLKLTGAAAERLAFLTPDGLEAHIHVTLTDDHPWAQAIVMIDARPPAPPEAA